MQNFRQSAWNYEEFGNYGNHTILVLTVEATPVQQWVPQLDPLFNHSNNKL
jgi:hypothetical protein